MEQLQQRWLSLSRVAMLMLELELELANIGQHRGGNRGAFVRAHNLKAVELASRSIKLFIFT